MKGKELHVRNVRGRYGRGVLRSQNVTAQVTEVARVYQIWLDDSANADAWLEMVVEVETEEADVPCEKSAAGSP